MDPERGLRSCSSVFMRLGRFDRARTFLALEAGSDWTTQVESFVRLWSGDLAGATEIAAKLPAEHPIRQLFMACSNPDKGLLKQKGKEARELGSDDSESFFIAAAIFAACGEPDTAVALLRRSIDQNYCAPEVFDRDYPVGMLRDHPQWDSLRREAIACRDRFQSYVDRHPPPS